MARLDAMLSQYFQVKDKPAEPPAAVSPTPAEQLALTNSAGIAVPNTVAFVKPSGVTTEPVEELLVDSGLPTAGLGAAPNGCISTQCDSHR